ncbi:MAG: glycosyltransferase [Colwellia sp.]|jgi:Glycosyltransferase
MKVVISGPNFTSGGPLSVMSDLLLEVANHKDMEVVALVHSMDLYPESLREKITFMTFPDSKSSWFKRVWYEYYYFSKLSKKIRPDIWLSMHDITPNVEASFLATYCHNSSPFYDCKWRDFIYDRGFFLFSKFYKYLYRINIKKNDALFVQQVWMKDAFEELFDIDNVSVVNPGIKLPKLISRSRKENLVTEFFYPSFPRLFKNFEVICAAAERLEKLGEVFKVFLTIDGEENKYSSDVVKRYGHLESIEFIGLQSRDKVYEYYERCDVLIFPSKLETWGLPISEFQAFDKPLIVADLPYAKETVGTYSKVDFFDPDNDIVLAEMMLRHISKDDVTYSGNVSRVSPEAVGWKSFVGLVKDKYRIKREGVVDAEF